MEDFGSRLKKARKNKSITQKELARQLGVEQSTISNYEKNFRSPSAAALIELSDQLQVSVDYLLGRSIPQESNSTPETSEEVSGSFLIDDSTKALRTSFLNYLIQGQFQEAADLIMNYQSPDTDLMGFNLRVFEPTLKKLGVLWETGEISVAEEHMISDVITRIMTRLEHARQGSHPNEKKYTAALMLTGAEEHEFPLRMIEAVFKHHGWITFYLGKNIPISSLEDFLRKNRIDLLGLSVTLSSHLNNCEILIRTVKAMEPDIRPKIMVGGRAIINEEFAQNHLGADFYLESQQALDESLDDIEKQLR